MHPKGQSQRVRDEEIPITLNPFLESTSSEIMELRRACLRMTEAGGLPWPDPSL
jgi:hypothetical protein